MEEVMRLVIAAITAGAAEGAAALRRSGVAVELDIFSVEARIDATPTASVRLDFVVPAAIDPLSDREEGFPDPPAGTQRG